jgi:acetyl esterase/lipase
MDDARSVNGDDAIWTRIASLGATLDKDVIAASFAMMEPLVEALLPGETVESEEAYGPHERHRIDLYRGAGPSERPRPLLLFIHGGGYASGDKRMGPFFANLGRWAAASGLVCATMNYRLAPEHGWPSAQEDIRDALLWLRSNAGRLGADPGRIVLMGHSAGAGHSAAYAANSRYHAEAGLGIAGLILISGVYDLALAGDFGRASRSLYYGNGDPVEAERSSLPGLASVDVPIAVMIAEHDPGALHAQALALLDAIYRAKGVLPAFTRLAGHNHYTEILSAGLPMAAQLHLAILVFISHDCAAGANSARPE